MARSCTPRPLLLIDEDGVVSLFGFPRTHPAGLLPAAVEGIPSFLSAHAAVLPTLRSAVSERHW